MFYPQLLRECVVFFFLPCSFSTIIALILYVCSISVHWRFMQQKDASSAWGYSDSSNSSVFRPPVHGCINFTVEEFRSWFAHNIMMTRLLSRGQRFIKPVYQEIHRTLMTRIPRTALSQSGKAMRTLWRLSSSSLGISAAQGHTRINQKLQSFQGYSIAHLQLSELTSHWQLVWQVRKALPTSKSSPIFKFDCTPSRHTTLARTTLAMPLTAHAQKRGRQSIWECMPLTYLKITKISLDKSDIYNMSRYLKPISDKSQTRYLKLYCIL